ncbi:MAG: hypothetical protein HKM87_03000 [Ignavibacteriaceae bacterium]|nr:hypothetical protein [Ignavibacteriaceae bacterium]
MKTKIILSLLSLLLISGAFTEGCEEEEPKPDYITVNVTAAGNMLLKDNTTGELSCDSRITSIPVRVDMIKAGGETFTFYATLGPENCYIEAGPATFKLYREQPIEVIAYTETVLPGFTQIRASEFLSWDEVYPGKDFGETFAWEAWLRGYWLYN